MTPTDRAALRAAAEKATPGPWEMKRSFISPDIISPVGLVVAVTIASDMKPSMDEANAAYIALANPAAVLALLDDVERMREALSMCLRVMEGIAHHEASPMGRACSAGNAALEPRA